MRLIKENVIVLRTIFLEFGDQELREKRMMLPYENMDVEEDKPRKGNPCPANLGPFVDSLNSFGNPDIDDVVFNFHLVDAGEGSRLVIVEGKQQGFDYIYDDNDEEGTEGLERMYFLKGISKSEFFINLRKGLYYKSIWEHSKAIEYLKAAHKIYLKTLDDIVKTTVQALHQLVEKFYDFDKKVMKESFSLEEYGPLSEMNLLPELFISIEEMPSFHLGEICLEMGNEHFNKYEELRDRATLDLAKKSYEEAIDYFKDIDQWCILFDTKLRNLRMFFGNDVIPVSPFKRNCYLEISRTIAKNQLKCIDREKYISTIKVVEKPDPAFLLEERQKRLAAEEESRKWREEATLFSSYIDSIPLPMKVELDLFKIFNESEELFWIDKNFNFHGLDYLKSANIAGKVKEIKILTGPEKIDSRFKSSFQTFKKEMSSEGTNVGLKVLTTPLSLQRLHNRYIKTDKTIYDVPPINSIKKRQVCSITEVKKEDVKRIRQELSELWDKGIDIIKGDLDTIQHARLQQKWQQGYRSGPNRSEYGP